MVIDVGVRIPVQEGIGRGGVEGEFERLEG